MVFTCSWAASVSTLFLGLQADFRHNLTFRSLLEEGHNPKLAFDPVDRLRAHATLSTACGSDSVVSESSWTEGAGTEVGGSLQGVTNEWENPPVSVGRVLLSFCCCVDGLPPLIDDWLLFGSVGTRSYGKRKSKLSAPLPRR